MSFHPLSLFSSGQDGLIYNIQDTSTLYEDSSLTTLASIDGVVGGIEDIANDNNATQGTTASKGILRQSASGTYYIEIDKTDDNYVITIPTGGWTGSMIIATLDGSVHATVDIPAGSYDLVKLSGSFFPGDEIVGFIIRDGEFTDAEITRVLDWVESRGAKRSYSGFSGSMTEFFRQWDRITTLDVSDWDTSSVTSFRRFTRDCLSLTTLDVSGWDTSSVTSFNSFVFNCPALTTLDVSGWDTSSVTDLNSFARECTSLTSLDISGWDTSGVTDIRNFVNGSTSLTTITVGSAFDNATSTTNFANSFFNCALDQTTVDAILVSIDNAGTSNGTLDLDGGTNASPSATGDAAKTSLEGRGWTVTVN